MSTASTRTVPLLDLKAQFRPIAAELQAAVNRVIESQGFIMGADVKELEKEIAAYCGAQFAIGCASGSDALFLALLGVGVEPGDEVLTTPYTFFATAGAIHRAGARPVFADIDINTFNLDAASVKKVLDTHPKIKAIIPVHLFGACAEMDSLAAMARERGIQVIEDAAQAIGSEMNDRRAGTLGDVACFSFFPSKNLGGFGDGGIITTNHSDLAAKIAALRVHGSKKKYYHQYVGVNSRLDTLQAAVLRVKLKYLDGWTAARQKNADYYRALFTERKVPITLPALHPSTTRHIYNQFVIRCERRNELQAFMKERGIGSEIYYPLCMHMQECFAFLGYQKGDFPMSEAAADTSLAIPIYGELAQDDINYVVDTIASFYAQ